MPLILLSNRKEFLSRNPAVIRVNQNWDFHLEIVLEKQNLLYRYNTPTTITKNQELHCEIVFEKQNQVCDVSQRFICFSKTIS